MQKGKILKRMGAMFLAAALTVLPLATALAENNNLPDPNAAGSITVHKYLRDIESTTVGTGKEITEASVLQSLGTPAAGIDFTLYKVKSTYEVTNATTVAQALTNATEISKKTTDANGVIKWEWPSAAAGYYVLVEDKATVPAGYTASPDSIIALPYAVDDEVWNYDIHVYPKNVSEKELIKTVDNKAAGYSVGDVVDWNYKGKVDLSKLYHLDDTVIPETEAYGTYKIIDALDPRLTYTSTTSVIGVGGHSNVTLTVNTHYIVDTTATPGTVTWSLTPEGIKELAKVDATGIEVKFKTTVNDKAFAESSSESIINGGILDWSNKDGVKEDGYTIPETEKPSVKLYNIVIKKTNNDGTKLLNGAKFKIAVSEVNAKAGTFIKVGAADVVVTTAAHPTDTTITGGWAMFAGLPVNSTVDTEFWLVEDVAPTVDGEEYIRPGDPIKVTIKNITGATDTEKTTASITVINYLPDDPDLPDKWKLPLTGGMGTVLFYVIGSFVMMGAVLLFVRSKKMKTAN